MMISQLTFILLTVVALSAGQVLFKIAAVGIERSAVRIERSAAGFVRSLPNVNLLAALLVYFVATIVWLLVLGVTQLWIAYPFAVFAFVVAPLMAHYLLDEAIGSSPIAGAILIGAGVCVCRR